MPLSAVRPSHVKAWTAKFRAKGLADSYVYALHARLAQVMGRRRPRRDHPEVATLAAHVTRCRQAAGLRGDH
jgi:hypothetical protein